ncbi:MAG: helix-turn-helix transcriptional regulator [Nitrospira sp.]
MLTEQLAAVFAHGEQSPLHARLSDCEMQVLGLLGKGKPVFAVAEGLHLSVKTISTYRPRILEKLSCQSTAELIRYALGAHLID